MKKIIYSLPSFLLWCLGLAVMAWIIFFEVHAASSLIFTLVFGAAALLFVHSRTLASANPSAVSTAKIDLLLFVGIALGLVLLYLPMDGTILLGHPDRIFSYFVVCFLIASLTNYHLSKKQQKDG